MPNECSQLLWVFSILWELMGHNSWVRNSQDPASCRVSPFRKSSENWSKVQFHKRQRAGAATYTWQTISETRDFRGNNFEIGSTLLTVLTTFWFSSAQTFQPVRETVQRSHPMMCVITFQNQNTCILLEEYSRSKMHFLIYHLSRIYIT